MIWRAIWIAAVLVMASAGWLWLLPSSLGGHTVYVSTHGDSMEPQFHTGDLALLRPSNSYRAGDVVAYHSELLKTVVMHRIVAVDAGRYTFKGDHNSWLDPDQPTQDHLIGTLAVHIPQGGLWLERLTSPPMLGVVAFFLLATGSGTATLVIGRGRRRRRQHRRKAAMSRHTSDRPAQFLAVNSLPPSLRTSAAITLVLGILGATLGVLAWTGPLEVPSTAEVKSGTRMDFSYSADVGQTPAYDGSTAHSPDPVFRKLADTVDVHFTYHGEPGSVIVAAELTTPEGWHSTVPLADAVAFTGNRYEGTVSLDLKAFDAKAKAASAATGIAASQVAIKVITQVKTTSGADFRPELKLTLTSLQLALANGEKDITVTDTSTVEHAVVVPRTLGINGWNITAATARIISVVLLLAALATAAIVLVFARRTAPADEAAAIRRRYAALLVPVHPMTAPQGRPVIDVTSFATLAKLAERYGLLVLHWARSGVETFVVQDENITYRYRAGAESVHAESQPQPVNVEP
jgi:signal peptidase I